MCIRDRLDAYRSFERYLNEHGITGVCDVSLMAMPGLDFCLLYTSRCV